MKKTISLLLALGLLLLLAACGGKEPPQVTVLGEEAGDRQGVTLNVVTSYGGDDGHRPNFEAAVRAYEESTGNIVNDGSATSNEEWKMKVLADFETGSEPDVLFYFTNADAEPLIRAKKVVSIREIREVYPDYAGNMKESMMAVAFDGESYAVPSSGYWENMFVNKRVLAACGVEIPGPDYTWDQFLADCQTIRENGYTPIACSLFEVPHYWFEFAVMNNGSLADHMTVPETADDPAGQKWAAALNDLKDLYERGCFPANTLTATDPETVAMFCQGEAAFLVDGSWKIGYLMENHEDQLEDYAVAYVPGKGERRASEAIGGISMGYFITRKAWDDPEKREAAVEFVRQLTSDETLSGFVTTEITALKEGTAPVDLNALQRSAAEANGQITGMTGAVQDTISGEAKASLFANVKNVVAGTMTAREAVEAAIALN